MKILNIGSCNIDLVYSVKHITRPGETLSANSMNTFPGGKGLNQSIALARAGQKVYHAGCIGDDGIFLRDLMSENGVDTRFMRVIDDRTGHAIIQVSSDGENAITIYPGANHALTKEYIDQVLSVFSQGDIVVFQNEISELPYALEEAYKKGMCVILNPSPINKTILELDFNKISYLVLNEVEARDITSGTTTEKCIQYFKEKYPSLKVMLTLGKNGCMYSDAKQTCYHPVFDTEVVDTTAAGDTFTGYFVSELAKETDIPRILAIASGASAIAISRPGAAPSVPTYDEVIAFLDKAKKKGSTLRQERLSDMLDKYVSENFKDASLSELAEFMGYSPSHAALTVRRLTGLTFKQYVQNKRLSACADMLEKTDLSINEIIGSVGYENKGYFRKLFVEKFGVKPLEYRKKKRSKGNDE